LPDIEVYPISERRIEPNIQGGHSEVWIAVKSERR